MSRRTCSTPRSSAASTSTSPICRAPYAAISRSRATTTRRSSTRSPTMAARSPRSRASIARPTTTRASSRCSCARPIWRTAIDDRVTALVEAAGLYAQLGRTDDAIATWEQVLAIAPERRDAVDALEPLYRSRAAGPTSSISTSAGSASRPRTTRRSRCACSSARSTRRRCATSRARSITTPPRCPATRATPPRSPRSSAISSIPTCARPPPRCSSRSTSASIAGPI